MNTFFRTTLLLFMLFLAACGSKETLLTNISEDEANQVVTVLLKSGISADKVANGANANILVPKDKLAQSVTILRMNGIPRAHYAKFEEIFPSSSFTSSPTEERARYIYLLSQSLESTLASIEGVVLARVHVVLPQKATFLDPSVGATASVLIQHLPSIDLSNLSPDIARLVANSVPGLVPEKVAVMLVETTSAGTSVRTYGANAVAMNMEGDGSSTTPLAVDTHPAIRAKAEVDSPSKGGKVISIMTEASSELKGGHSWYFVLGALFLLGAVVVGGAVAVYMYIVRRQDSAHYTGRH